MIAEPVPLVPMDDGNFTSDATVTVVLGDCRCPGRPHDDDTAEVRTELSWDVLVDVGLLAGGAAYRRLVSGALVAWNLTDIDGDPVPIEMVTRLRSDRIEAIARAVNEAFAKAQAPLPNASGAPSRRSRRVSASPDPTTPTPAKRTR
jgi:hypothetical protein